MANNDKESTSYCPRYWKCAQEMEIYADDLREQYMKDLGKCQWKKCKKNPDAWFRKRGE